MRGRRDGARRGANRARRGCRRSRGRNGDHQCRLVGAALCRFCRHRAKPLNEYPGRWRERSLVENRAQPVRLGRGFWTVTALLAVLGAAGIVFWYVFPLEQYLPAAIVTARQVDTLFRFMAATGTALYIFVCGYLIYFAIAFRVRPSDPPDAIGLQIHDNPKLEFWWAVVPVLFVI